MDSVMNQKHKVWLSWHK